MLLRSLAVAVVGLGLGIAAITVADAYPAQTTGTVNVRAGPGIGYAKIGVLGAYTPVDVDYCRPGWCSVSFGYGSGWVSASYIAGGGYAEPFYPQYQPQPFFFGFGYGYGNHPHPHPWPYPPPPPPEPPPGVFR